MIYWPLRCMYNIKFFNFSIQNIQFIIVSGTNFDFKNICLSNIV